MSRAPEEELFADSAAESMGRSGAPFNLAQANTGPPQARLVVERGVSAEGPGKLAPFDLAVDRLGGKAIPPAFAHPFGQALAKACGLKRPRGRPAFDYKK